MDNRLVVHKVIESAAPLKFQKSISFMKTPYSALSLVFRIEWVVSGMMYISLFSSFQNSLSTGAQRSRCPKIYVAIIVLQCVN